MNRIVIEHLMIPLESQVFLFCYLWQHPHSGQLEDFQKFIEKIRAF